MKRATLILANDKVRAKAVTWVQRLPQNTRVDFKEPKRTLEQSAKMWAMLTDIATQKEHCGRKYTADEWKCLFLHALGREVQFIPALDGTGFIPYGQSSSDLGKSEMSDMIELMHAWGAANGVVFHDEVAA